VSRLVNMQKYIAAGIVLYNPDDVERVNKSIKSVLDQIGKVYIFDNSTDNRNYSFPDKVDYMTEHSNKGVAYALNRIMEKAKTEGYKWVVTMDQDSILPENTVSLYEKHMHDDSNIAIICPQAIDFRRIYLEAKREPVTEFVDFCITSASCTLLDAWEKIGGFDEWLFIDLVDNEFCKRIVVSGYKILRLNELVLDQEFGKIIPKSQRKQNFWLKISKVLHNSNFAKFGYKKDVRPIRVYYTNRNIIYVNRKLKNYGPIGYENYNCKGYLGFLISFSCPSILRAQEKKKVIKAVFEGIRDGRKAQVNRWETSNE